MRSREREEVRKEERTPCRALSALGIVDKHSLFSLLCQLSVQAAKADFSP